jgi:molecular chaperone HtpG
LHIAEDSLEFLEKENNWVIEQIQQVHAYSIKFGTKTETLPKPEDAPEDYVAETVETDNIINNLIQLGQNNQLI